MKHPYALWGLIFWLLFLAFGGLYGGVAMLLLSLILAVWLIAQGVLIGFRFQWPIQYVTAVNGLFILLLAMSPSVRKRYTAIRLEKPR